MFDDLLKRVPLFSSLSRRDICLLEKISKRLELPAGTILFKEGEISDRLYVIAEGELEIVKAFGTPDEIVLKACSAGECFGEKCFLKPNELRSATLRAKTKVRLIEIARDDFELLLLDRPGIAQEILRSLSQRRVDAESSFIGSLAEKSRKLAVQSKHIETSLDETSTSQINPSRSEDKAGIPQLKINALGKFQLIRGETLITRKEWSAAKKPQMLLKALITRGAENVPMDLP